MYKATMQFQGFPVHITFEVLPRNIVTWHLNPEKYQQVDQDLVKLAEALLRQIHCEELQMAALEHAFYQDMMEPSYPDYIPGEDEEDIPF